MTIFETRLNVTTKAYVPANDEESARRMWTYFAGSSFDLADVRWVALCGTSPFTIFPDLNIEPVRRGTQLRPILYENVRVAIEQEPVVDQDFLRPTGGYPEVALKIFPLDVALQVTGYITKGGRSSVAEVVEYLDLSVINLSDAAKFWLSMDGLESEVLPMVVSRTAVISGFSGNDRKPTRRTRSSRMSGASGSSAGARHLL